MFATLISRRSRADVEHLNGQLISTNVANAQIDSQLYSCNCLYSLGLKIGASHGSRRLHFYMYSIIGYLPTEPFKFVRLLQYTNDLAG